MYNDKKYDKIKLCIYNKTSKKTEVIKESEIDKDSKNVNYKFQFNGCIVIHNNNIFYAANSSENNGVNKVYQYDMDTKKEKILYSEKDRVYFINSFDIDMNSGYIICCIYDDKNNGYLKLVNFKNNSQKVLAKFENDVKVNINYPNVVFTLNNDIHIYNINKNDDDVLIKCNDEIKDMEIYDNKIYIKSNNIYCYSLNDKKSYKLDYPDDFNKKYFGIGVSEGKASWYDENGLHYMVLK